MSTWEVRVEPGTLIRSRRLAHGLTQAQLARRVGTTQSAISRLESGREMPTIARLEQLLVALGERLVVEVSALDPGRPWPDVVADRAKPMGQRLEEGFALSAFASELAGSADR